MMRDAFNPADTLPGTGCEILRHDSQHEVITAPSATAPLNPSGAFRCPRRGSQPGGAAAPQPLKPWDDTILDHLVKDRRALAAAD